MKQRRATAADDSATTAAAWHPGEIELVQVQQRSDKLSVDVEAAAKIVKQQLRYPNLTGTAQIKMFPDASFKKLRFNTFTFRFNKI